MTEALQSVSFFASIILIGWGWLRRHQPPPSGRDAILATGLIIAIIPGLIVSFCEVCR